MYSPDSPLASTSPTPVPACSTAASKLPIYVVAPDGVAYCIQEKRSGDRFLRGRDAAYLRHEVETLNHAVLSGAARVERGEMPAWVYQRDPQTAGGAA